ncbi:MAG: alpha/beta fold hydrolase, partial [Caldilineaceae bacterium]
IFHVGGVHIHTLADGDQHVGAAPAVVLHTGLLAPALTWSRVVPLVAKFAPVLAVDRPGYAWSDPPAPDSLRSGDDIVAETRALLQIAGHQPPYLLVGHSLGAIYCLIHAYEYPEEVAGLVLVDPSHPRQMQVKGLPSERVYRWNVGFVGASVKSPFGGFMGRLAVEQTLGPMRYVLSPAEWQAAVAIYQQPAFYNAAVAETRALTATLAAADGPPGSLDATPLAILEAGDWFSSRSLGIRAKVRALRQEMLGLSSRSTHTIVPNTNHVSLPLLAPQSVADAVRNVLDASQTV